MPEDEGSREKEIEQVNIQDQAGRLPGDPTSTVLDPPDPIIESVRGRVNDLAVQISELERFKGNRIVSINADYSAKPNDTLIWANGTAGGVEVLLPLAKDSPGRQILVVKTDSSSNVVDLDPSPGDTLVFNLNDDLETRDAGILCVSDGLSKWYLVPYAHQRLIDLINAVGANVTTLQTNVTKLQNKIYMSSNVGSVISVPAASGQSFYGSIIFVPNGGTLKFKKGGWWISDSDFTLRIYEAVFNLKYTSADNVGVDSPNTTIKGPVASDTEVAVLFVGWNNHGSVAQNLQVSDGFWAEFEIE